MCRKLGHRNFERCAEGLEYHVNYRELLKIGGQGKAMTRRAFLGNNYIINSGRVNCRDQGWFYVKGY